MSSEEADRDQPNNNVSVFPYPGGKGREAGWILEKMPPHDTFVDVFGGSGAIIYNKPPSKYEVYNDVNDDLVQFFEVRRSLDRRHPRWRRVPRVESVQTASNVPVDQRGDRALGVQFRSVDDGTVRSGQHDPAATRGGGEMSGRRHTDGEIIEETRIRAWFDE